jgi:hypothetical protein
MLSTNVRRIATVAVITAATAGCTVHSTEPPPLTGPSELAHALRLTASPASIPQDGVTTSTITILAIDPSGHPEAGVPLRVDIMAGGTGVDFGTLSARSLTTGASGTVTVTYTAPAAPANGIFDMCNGVTGNCVDIVAAPTNTQNFVNINPASVQIRLMPVGNIIPIGDFTFTPAAPKALQDVTFDASGVLADPGRTLVSYRWDLGDGAVKLGNNVTHDFVAGTYNVTLTVTDDAGKSKVIGKRITVS